MPIPSWAHFYVEDGWKITQNLKLDAGLRYEFNENLLRPHESELRISTLLPPAGPPSSWQVIRRTSLPQPPVSQR